jgi:hypothetical protein
MTAGVPEGRFVIHRPTPDSASVQVWADDHIRFEHLPPSQKYLRDEIRSRYRQLEPSAGQFLHATSFGPNLPHADVENLVLYNIDTFRVAGRNGIRFEYGAAGLLMVLRIGSTTATRSRHGRTPSPIGGKGEHWPRSTGPTWVRSSLRSS